MRWKEWNKGEGKVGMCVKKCEQDIGRQLRIGRDKRWEQMRREEGRGGEVKKGREKWSWQWFTWSNISVLSINFQVFNPYEHHRKISNETSNTNIMGNMLPPLFSPFFSKFDSHYFFL